MSVALLHNPRCDKAQVARIRQSQILCLKRLSLLFNHFCDTKMIELSLMLAKASLRYAFAAPICCFSGMG